MRVATTDSRDSENRQKPKQLSHIASTRQSAGPFGTVMLLMRSSGSRQSLENRRSA
jgi:hypothetical protein